MVATKYLGNLRRTMVLMVVGVAISACAQGTVSPDGGAGRGAPSADSGNPGNIVDASRPADAGSLVPPADARPSPPDAAVPRPDAMPLEFPPGTTGTTMWSGEYDCVQGKTALVLEITRSAAGDTVTATFSFSEHPSNPGTPSGSYSMSGTYSANSRRISLQPQAWISQPDGYSMVGLEGEHVPDSPPRLTGTVQTSGCTSFDVSLQ